MMDVTVDITSAIHEVIQVNSERERGKAIQAGLNIGRAVSAGSFVLITVVPFTAESVQSQSYDLMLHPASNHNSSAEYFVSLQGGVGKRSGSSADRRQRGRWQNRQCWNYDYWLDGVLVQRCISSIPVTTAGIEHV